MFLDIFNHFYQFSLSLKNCVSCMQNFPSKNPAYSRALWTLSIIHPFWKWYEVEFQFNREIANCCSSGRLPSMGGGHKGEETEGGKDFHGGAVLGLRWSCDWPQVVELCCTSGGAVFGPQVELCWASGGGSWGADNKWTSDILDICTLHSLYTDKHCIPIQCIQKA